MKHGLLILSWIAGQLLHAQVFKVTTFTIAPTPTDQAQQGTFYYNLPDVPEAAIIKNKVGDFNGADIMSENGEHSIFQSVLHGSTIYSLLQTTQQFSCTHQSDKVQFELLVSNKGLQTKHWTTSRQHLNVHNGRVYSPTGTAQITCHTFVDIAKSWAKIKQKAMCLKPERVLEIFCCAKTLPTEVIQLITASLGSIESLNQLDPWMNSIDQLKQHPFDESKTVMRLKKMNLSKQRPNHVLFLLTPKPDTSDITVSIIEFDNTFLNEQFQESLEKVCFSEE